MWLNIEGARRGMEGYRGGSEGCGGGAEGHKGGTKGEQRGAEGCVEGWLPLATINLVGDNREFEV